MAFQVTAFQMSALKVTASVIGFPPHFKARQNAKKSQKPIRDSFLLKPAQELTKKVGSAIGPLSAGFGSARLPSSHFKVLQNAKKTSNNNSR